MTTSSPERKRLIDGLKLILPAVILVAIGFAFLRRANQTLLPVVLDFATDAAIGITSGFTTRWSLKRRSEFLRSIVAVSMAVSALIMLGIITWGSAGIRMLYLHEDVDWNGLSQVIIAASSALMALRSWSWQERVAISAPDSLPEPIVPRSQPTSSLTRSTPPVPISSRTNHRPRIRSRASMISSIPRPFIAPRWRIPRWRMPRWRILQWKMPRWKMPSIPLSNFDLRDLLRFRESQVKFTGATEQRCPYCLDVITKNDPRGVQVCSICHTPHHADCWAMTGVCQIPHYHG